MIDHALLTDKGGLGRLAAWHLPGGPVGPWAWWAATSNVAGGSETEEEARGPLAIGNKGFPWICYRRHGP